jgi:hypothetical protein
MLEDKLCLSPRGYHRVSDTKGTEISSNDNFASWESCLSVWQTGNESRVRIPCLTAEKWHRILCAFLPRPVAQKSPCCRELIGF